MKKNTSDLNLGIPDYLKSKPLSILNKYII